MKIGIAFILSSVWLSTFKGCGIKESASPEEFVAWTENATNGLRLEKEVGDYKFTLQYKPYEYMVIKDLQKIELSEQEVKESINNINEAQYFSLYIENKKGEELLKDGAEDVSDYYARLEYFSTQMQQQLKIVQNKDTLNCVLFHMERNFGTAPYTSFVMAFEKGSGDEKPTDKEFIYDDKLLGTATVKMIVAKENLDHIPNLIYN